MPIDLEDIQAWLLELGQNQAAALLEEAVLEFEYIDTVFRMDSGSDVGTDIFDISIRVPSKIYRQLSTNLQGPADQVVKAIVEITESTSGSTWIRTTQWRLRVPKLKEVQSFSLTDEVEKISDVSDVRRLWEKAKARLASDPEGAITASRTLLESTLGFCITRIGGTYTRTESLPALFKLAVAGLQVGPNAATEEEYKKLLGACATIVNSIATIRNRESDAHVTSGAATYWHAQLVVNLSGAVANFLLALPAIDDDGSPVQL